MKKSYYRGDIKSTLAHGRANSIGPFANPRRRGEASQAGGRASGLWSGWWPRGSKGGNGGPRLTDGVLWTSNVSVRTRTETACQGVPWNPCFVIVVVGCGRWLRSGGLGFAPEAVV